MFAAIIAIVTRILVDHCLLLLINIYGLFTFLFPVEVPVEREGAVGDGGVVVVPEGGVGLPANHGLDDVREVGVRYGQQANRRRVQARVRVQPGQGRPEHLRDRSRKGGHVGEELWRARGHQKGIQSALIDLNTREV